MSKDVKNLSSDIKSLTAEEIRDLAAPLTDEETDAINKGFPSYVFYRTLKDGSKECFCSVCREHYVFNLPRTYSEKEVIFLNSKHNDIGFCSKCGTEVRMKNIGRAKNAQNLWFEWRFVVPQIINENSVLLRCYYARKSYSQTWYEKCKKTDEERFCSPPKIQLSRVYLLQPGKVVNATLENWFSSKHWAVRKTSNEPFHGNRGMGSFYDVINLDTLSRSFLKYAPFELFREQRYSCSHNYFGMYNSIKIVSFFCRCAESPALEVLVKLGYIDPVNRYIYGNMPNKRLIDWQKVKPWEIFRLSKTEYKIFEQYVMRGREQHLNWALCLEIYKDFKKLHISGGMKRVLDIVPMVQFRYRWDEIVVPYIKSGGNLTHLENYLKKQKLKKQSLNDVLVQWADYLDMAAKLKYDTNQEIVKFPKRLKKAHDTASQTLRLIAEEKRRKELAEVYKAAEPIIKGYMKKYSYIGEKYSIVLPESAEDIVREGQLMHHCVGGYAERHFTGKLCICFLRKNDEIDKPLYTIEMRDKTLGQVQGYANRNPIYKDPEAKAFFDEWLEWVENGSKKNKKKKKTAVSVA